MRPHLIHFPKLGDSAIGFISVAETLGTVPFEVRRLFWTYGTPEHIVRGRHAHRQTQQVLLAVAGRVIVTTEDVHGDIQLFRLDNPSIGLYVPPHVWRTIQYSDSAVQLVLASHLYNEADYIRSREEFQQAWQVRI